MDGSSEPFVDLLKKQVARTRCIKNNGICIDENIYLQDENKRVDMVAMPCA
jgi:UDP-3-O-acyl-N-acetylglucosamine deacetylase